MSKPFSQSCENNKDPILAVIREYFRTGTSVLEIGSYTAQHVLYFAGQLPGITWQPSDTSASLEILGVGLEGANLPNILPPVVLDVCDQPWPVEEVDGIFSANTLHIMSIAHVTCFFRGAGSVLKPGGYLCVYGPFKYNGQYTSESNARFQEWLLGQDPLSGIRDFDTVNSLAEKAGMHLVEDHAMPANNQLLVWQKTG